jgi:hypothetical protein
MNMFCVVTAPLCSRVPPVQHGGCHKHYLVSVELSRKNTVSSCAAGGMFMYQAHFFGRAVMQQEFYREKFGMLINNKKAGWPSCAGHLAGS